MRASVAVALGFAAWLPTVHVVFRPQETTGSNGLTATARALTTRYLSLWADPARRAAEIHAIRRSNAEWDFMGRTFLVLSLANVGLRDPSLQGRALLAMDTIIDETLRLEREHGKLHFMMPYGGARPFVSEGGRSIFEDGEIAVMIAARRLLEEREDLKAALAERATLMVAQMRESAVLSAESYPNECWTFCNTIGLAALAAQDKLDGTRNRAFIVEWLRTARARLIDPRTGLLVSSFTVDGEPLDGPEGSSIWTASHFLSVVDPDFAADQYRRAKHELAGSALGFGYAREWPASWPGTPDVDSGPILPGLEISLGSSGQALLGAATFHDDRFLGSLLTSLDFGGFPVRSHGELRYAASNTVGDAMILYSLAQGPLWEKVRR
jgi:Linalool dehydratase/isomerase